MDPYNGEYADLAVAVSAATDLNELSTLSGLTGDTLDGAVRRLAAEYGLDDQGTLWEVAQRFQAVWNQPIPDEILVALGQPGNSGTGVQPAEFQPQSPGSPNWFDGLLSPEVDMTDATEPPVSTVTPAQSRISDDNKDIFQDWVIASADVADIATAFTLDSGTVDREIRLLADLYGLPSTGDVETVRQHIRVLVGQATPMAEQPASSNNYQTTTTQTQVTTHRLPDRGDASFRPTVANLVANYDNPTLQGTLSVEDKRKLFKMVLELGRTDLGNFDAVCDFLRGEARLHRL